MEKVWTDERVERLIALLEERRQNKSLFHPTMPAWHNSLANAAIAIRVPCELSMIVGLGAWQPNLYNNNKAK